MAYPGIAFMLNHIGVTSPDDIDWTPISMGDALDGLERRSHYRTVRWAKNAHWGCDLDWFQFDNTELNHFICPPPDQSRQYEVYTEAFCKSVKAIHRHGNMYDIQAIFLVKVD